MTTLCSVCWEPKFKTFYSREKVLGGNMPAKKKAAKKTAKKAAKKAKK